MKSLLTLAQVALVALLVSCGGGGGSPGAVSTGGVSGTTPSSSTTVTATADGTISVELLNGSGQPTQSISAIEIAAIKVTVKDAKGIVVPGTIVTFSESGVGLLKFSPDAKTALTTSEGIASLEVRAADQTRTGATTISVGATVDKTIITASKVLEVTNAPVTIGVPVDPQSLATAINFVSTDPADKAIVLKGAGGNGRTETGILSFRVVDKNGTPVKGVTVDFVVNPANDVVLNIVQSKTDGDGIVTTSVSSKLVPTAVVVKATVAGKSITSQSDQLKVTTGLGVQIGFEIVPEVYDLDGGLTGDSTQITARLVDSNSNPVADGVPVVLVATGGKIGTSSAGGCNTVNGACTVTFEVQEPRPANGIVTITGSAKVGDTTTLLRQISINMSRAEIGIFENIIFPRDFRPIAPLSPLNALTELTVDDCRKFGKSFLVSNTLGYAAPAGTTIAVETDSVTGLGATIKGGGTVLDSLGSFLPSPLDVTFDPSSANTPPCSNTGIALTRSITKFQATAPKSKRVSRKFDLAINYPAGEMKLVKFGTADQPVAINMAACEFETTRLDVLGTFNLPIPAGSTFVVSPSESSSFVDLTTTKPPDTFADPAIFPLVTADFLGPSTAQNRQSIWLRVKAPSAGVNPCVAVGKTVPSTFTLDLTVTTPTGQRNTKTITVTYPKV